MGDLAADARLLHGAADPGRLAILLRLAQDGTLPASQLTECCDRSQPTVSHRLRVLLETGWVTVTRCGNRRCYSIDPAALAAFARLGSSIAAPTALHRRQHEATEAAPPAEQARPAFDSLGHPSDT